MEGGEGSLSRCTAKSAAAAAAAATGPRGPLKRYPAGQRKAKKEAPATGPRGSSKGSSTKRKAAAKDPASRPMPPLTRAARRKKAKDDVSSDATAAMTRAPGEEEEEELDKYRRLSKADIRWILTLKPTKPPARFAALKRSNPDLTPQPGEEADEDKRRQYRLAKLFYELEENLPATQEWVRTELRDKGYVELDRETAKNRAQVQAVIDREWPAIEEKMKSLILAEKEYKKEYLARGGGGGGGSKSDSDDGEGSDGSDEEEDELYY